MQPRIYSSASREQPLSVSREPRSSVRPRAPFAARPRLLLDVHAIADPTCIPPGMTEFNPANAWIQNFDDGNQNDDDKNNDLQARAVRK